MARDESSELFGENMNKLITIFTAFLALSVPVLAATTVDHTWSGSGLFQTHVVAGNDRTSHFETAGNFVNGQYHLTDSEDNPYGYGVNTVNNWATASVSGGGYVYAWDTRDDSKTSMYGSAGQLSETGMYTNDGSIEYAFRGWTNYAEMGNCQYGWPKTPGGKNFEISGSDFYMYHTITDSAGDGAQVSVSGIGSASLKLQGEKSGGSGGYFNMGSLPVCGDGCAWKNNYATFTGTGAGTFTVDAWADNSLTVGCPSCSSGFTIPGTGADDSAQYHLGIVYGGTFSWQDFGVAGN